jgi:hypothetical protein
MADNKEDDKTIDLKKETSDTQKSILEKPFHKMLFESQSGTESIKKGPKWTSKSK